VSIDAGKRDALVFVLVHEATHVVDSSLGITPAPPTGEPPAAGTPPTAFTKGIWSEPTIPAPAYRDPLREHIRFRTGGETLAIDRAEVVYASLHWTPFVSLYGSRNWYEDLAEYVAVYHWTEVLKQPYRIVVRREGKEVFTYEAMKSDLVRGRVDQMRQFYEPGLDTVNGNGGP
jgi:hypothetical protein